MSATLQRDPQSPTLRQIAFLAFDDALATSISLPMELLNAANHLLMLQQKSPALDIELVASTASPLNMSGFLSVNVDQQLDPERLYDMIIIPSRWRHPHRSATPSLMHWLNLNARAGTEICSVGNGSYLAAQAGILDHRPATTHWHYFKDFAKRFPAVRLQRDYLMTEADNIYCAGSVNSAADLLIHLIDKHWGHAIARRVTQQFSPESRRPFSHNAFREDHLALHGDEIIALAQSTLASQLDQPLVVAELAAQSGLSVRSFQRRFSQATGLSPQQYLQKLRMDSAEELLRNSNLPVTDISHHCGFNDSSYFCKLFRQRYEFSPGEYRRSVRKKLFEVDNSPKNNGG